MNEIAVEVTVSVIVIVLCQTYVVHRRMQLRQTAAESKHHARLETWANHICEIWHSFFD